MSGRSRSIFGALTSGFVLKVSGSILNFLAVPVALHLLGEKTYAAFMAILGFSGWLALGSGGIGSLTAMSTAGQTKDGEKYQDQFWQAVISNLLGVTAAAVILIVPFNAFVRQLADGISSDELFLLQVSAYYCFGAIALTASSAAFEGRYIGLLRTSYCNVVRTVGQGLAIFLLFAVVPLIPNLLTITIALTAGPLVSSLWFIVRGTYDCPPPVHFRFDFKKSFPLVLHGSAFLASSLAVMFYGGGSLPLFAITFGKEQLATAGVMAKTVQLYFSLMSIVTTPLSVALKHAITAQDIAWAKRTLIISFIATTAGSSAISLVLFFFGGALIQLWAGVQLPGLQHWIAPLAFIVTVAGWYQFWGFASFASEGALPVALCAICEITAITLAYFAFGSHLSPASSLWITVLVMLGCSGIILPLRIIRFFRCYKA